MKEESKKHILITTHQSHACYVYSFLKGVILIQVKVCNNALVTTSCKPRRNF